MNGRPYKVRIEDIIQAMNKIEHYTKGMSRKRFMKDELTVDAVVRNLEVIGEAARNIPDSVVEEHSHISWHRMIGLRNILIHQYFGVDKDIVWDIITEDLPKEKPLLESLCKAL